MNMKENNSEDNDKIIHVNFSLKKKHITLLALCFFALLAVAAVVKVFDEIFDHDDDHHRYKRRYYENSRSYDNYNNRNNRYNNNNYNGNNNNGNNRSYNYNNYNNRW